MILRVEQDQQLSMQGTGEGYALADEAVCPLLCR